MGVHIISGKAVHDYEASKFITAELVEKIKKQDHSIPPPNYSKSRFMQNSAHQRFSSDLDTITKELSSQTRRCIEIMKEKGASN